MTAAVSRRTAETLVGGARLAQLLGGIGHRLDARDRAALELHGPREDLPLSVVQTGDRPAPVLGASSRTRVTGQ